LNALKKHNCHSDANVGDEGGFHEHLSGTGVAGAGACAVMVSGCESVIEMLGREVIKDIFVGWTGLAVN